MFASLLIANRGEIACRIARTAKRMGVRAIAVYSEADQGALHVAAADEAYPIGPARAAESYLDIARILEAAKASGAEAIHPGYGFLSENARFAQACAAAGIVFVGPPVKAMRLMGRKDDAKEAMRKHGIPVVPGYEGGGEAASALLAQAKKLGFPVMIKAVAGGGGRGMRLVAGPRDFEAALEGARREAEAAFGDGAVLIEKAVTRPRHIEVQVFADAHGNAVHLFERDCSLQRRHQKVIEEAPAPHLPQALRAAIAKAAVAAARAVDYTGAGTVEFLLAGGKLTAESPFYFLEMNTRLQVEHPVTEAVTGLDLVEWQLLIAAGERLPLEQSRITCSGWAVEARLYAEDPAHDFRPSAGGLAAAEWPQGEGVRVDTGMAAGDTVSPHYDTLIAKIIAHGGDRGEALARLARALEETLVAGPRTNLAFLHALIAAKAVRDGRFDTSFIDANLSRLIGGGPSPVALEAGAEALLAAAARRAETRRRRHAEDGPSPWSSGDDFALGPRREAPVTLLVDGEPRAFQVRWEAGAPRASLADDAKAKRAGAAAPVRMIEAGEAVIAIENLMQAEIREPAQRRSQLDVDAAGGILRSPLPGRVAKLYVGEGDHVEKGDRIAVLEAMKMEHVLHAPHAGTVEAVPVAQGQQVEQEAVVARIGEKEGA